MQTKITKMLGITHPILQGGMALNSDARLASAVSNAGGAGIIGGGGRSIEWLHDEIVLAQQLTQQPFGVNIPMPMRTSAEMIELCLQLRPRFVTLSAGKAQPEQIERLHQAGILVISVVANLRAALGAEKAGMDAIVLEGMESGGHIGEMTTMSLLVDVLPKLSVPVIAAGGLADGRALAAALAMGAEGVQVGTAFLLAEECNTHPAAKQAVINALAADVHMVGKYGSAAGMTRGIGEDFYRRYCEMEAAGPTEQERSDFFRLVNYRTSIDGEVETGLMFAGQAIDQLQQIRPAAEIIAEYMQQAEAALVRAAQFAQ